MAGVREKVAVVLAKTANDDKLIAALHAELAAARRDSGAAAGSRSGPGWLCTHACMRATNPGTGSASTSPAF
jgi:hypothetical protein